MSGESGDDLAEYYVCAVVLAEESLRAVAKHVLTNYRGEMRGLTRDVSDKLEALIGEGILRPFIADAGKSLIWEVRRDLLHARGIRE